MEHSPYPVVLDACVLYPARLRDLLMHLGIAGLYQPKWSAEIHREWCRNLLMNRPDITQAALTRTVESLRHPPLSTDDLLDMLLKQGLNGTVSVLKGYRHAI